MPITVAIVEDDAGTRESLARLLNGAPGFQCVGQFPTAEQALDKFPGLSADVILMDINLPKMSGIDCVARMKTVKPTAQVLMLTMYEDSENVFRALKAGASGYLVKRVSPEKLLAAIQEVRQGGSPMSCQIARKVVQFFHQSGPSLEPANDLTPREREILDLLVSGHLYKEIAEKLGLSVPTVNWHIRHIYDKLHVHSRGQAVAKYLKV